MDIVPEEAEKVLLRAIFFVFGACNPGGDMLRY